MDLILKIILISMVLIFSFFVYKSLILEHKKQINIINQTNKDYENKVNFLSSVVKRNKLKDSSISIDSMVDYLILSGIDAKYVYND